MSRQIDERVVSMEFDNARFEKNVAVSMGTIDRLKKALNFKGVSSGLDNMSSSIKKVDFSSINSGANSVRATFSALDVIAVTALGNITNAAVNTGRALLKNLTLKPVITGFKEYETQMNSVQTILANTQSKGTTIDDVTAALNELNTYADQTIYNFTEMTRNIGTFTAAGVDLDKSVTSIKGIANLAAMSGSTSAQAATAMYQLSQALAAGKVQLMDWNSVVNAGMGGEVFQNALKRTATQMGYNVDALIEKYGSFRESLTQGNWLTAEVLTETLTQLSGAYTEADLIAQGYTESQAKEIVKLADTALGAATDVKTFGQLMDTTMEAIGSSWAQTWQIIFGDFEESKELFTGMSTVISGLVNSFSEARNNLLSGALQSQFGNFSQQIEKAGVSQERFQQVLSNTASAHGKSLDEMIEKEGSLKKVIDAGLISKDMLVEALDDLSAAQSENGSATEEQVALMKTLSEQARDTGSEFGQMINQMSRRTGRELLIESLTNLLQPISTILKSIGSAWNDAFPPMSSDTLYKIVSALHSFSERLVISEKDAKNLTDTLRGVFAVVDIVASVVGGGLSLAFKATTKVISTLWSALGYGSASILDITASIGRAVAAIRDWWEENSLLNKGIEVAVPLLVELVKWIAELVKSIGDIPAVGKAFDSLGSNVEKLKSALESLTPQKAIAAFKNFGKTIQNAFAKLDINFGGVSDGIISGLANGIRDGAGNVAAAVAELASTILETIMGLLGIHSPSTKMYEVGENIILGLINGIKAGLSSIGEVASNIADVFMNVLGNLGWNKVFAVALSGGLVLAAHKSFKILESAMKPMEGIGAVLSSVSSLISASTQGIADTITNFSKVVKSFSKNLNAKAFKTRAEGIRDLAVSIAILAGAIAILAQLDTGKLWSAVGAIGALVLILGGLALATDKMSKSAVSIDKGGKIVADLKPSLVSMGVAILLLGATVKLIGSMNPEEAKQGFIGLAGVVAAMAGFMAAYGALVKGKAAANMDKGAKMLRKMAVSLLLMTAVVKLLSMMETADIVKGALAMTAFVGLMALMTKITTLGKNSSKLGGTLIKMAIAMGLMVGVIKLVSGLSGSEVAKGAVAIGAFIGIMALLSMITKFGGSAKIGTSLLAMSTSILIMVGVVKLISGLEPGEIAKGVLAISMFAGLVAALSIVAQIGGTSKIAGSLLAMSISIAILAGISILLSTIDVASLAKGIVAVSALALMVSLMTAATKNARNIQGTMIGISVAIGIMAASVAALSFIDPTRLAGATVALTTLLAALSVVVRASSGITGSIGPLVVMTVAIGLIGTILAVLSSLDIGNSIQIAASISMLMLAMSAALVVVGKLGTVSPIALVALGAMTLVVGALGLVLGLLDGINPNSALPIAISLSTLLLAMSGALAILTVIGLGGPAALIGVGSLMAAIVGLGSLMVGIGALTTYIPSIETFLNKGMGVLQQISTGLGSIIGGFVDGFLVGATANLPTVADNLSGFMEGLGPFLEGANSIDEGMMSGVTELAKALLVLTGADLISSLTSFITGGDSLTQFADQLVPFGEAMKDYGDVVADVNSEAITSSAKAAKALVQVADAIPNSGGLISKITGDNDLATFAKTLVPFGRSLMQYANAVAGLNGEAVAASISPAKSLIQLADGVGNNTGGLVSKVTGDNDLATFAKTLVPFGQGLMAYSNAVSGGINAEAISASVTAAKSLISLGDGIDFKSGGFLQGLLGEEGLGAVAYQLIPFGQAMVTYSNAVSEGIDTSAINASVLAARNIISLINSTVDLNTSGVQNYVSAINTLKTADIPGLIATFQNLGNTDFSSAGASMISSLVSGINGQRGSMTLAAQSIVSAFTMSITNASSQAGSAMSNVINVMQTAVLSDQSLVVNTATTLMQQFSQRIRSSSATVNSAVRSTISNAASTLKGYRSQFYSAGSYLVDGFAAGISDNAYKAAAKARAMARRAVEAAEQELGEHSPSKVFYRIGDFAVVGFVNAFSDGVRAVTKSSKTLAGSSVSAITDTMNGLGSLIDTSLDLTPVIKPRLDLSNLQRDSGRIASLFNSGLIRTKELAGTVYSTDRNRQVRSEVAAGSINDPNKQPKQVNQTFNQYNTSPKALSRTEIYRQTKNLFSMAKGAN